MTYQGTYPPRTFSHLSTCVRCTNCNPSAGVRVRSARDVPQKFVSFPFALRRNGAVAKMREEGENRGGSQVKKRLGYTNTHRVRRHYPLGGHGEESWDGCGSSPGRNGHLLLLQRAPLIRDGQHSLAGRARLSQLLDGNEAAAFNRGRGNRGGDGDGCSFDLCDLKLLNFSSLAVMATYASARSPLARAIGAAGARLAHLIAHCSAQSDRSGLSVTGWNSI